MKDWGHACLENDCIVQKWIDFLKQNEQEATVYSHILNTELIFWWRKTKQMLPDLPFTCEPQGNLYCLTKHNREIPLKGKLLEPLLTPWIWQIITQELPATWGLSMFVHSRTMQENLSWFLIYSCPFTAWINYFVNIMKQGFDSICCHYFKRLYKTSSTAKHSAFWSLFHLK